MIEVEIAPRWDAQRKGKRRREVVRNRRKVQQRIAMGQVRADVKSDDWGRWAVRGIMAVRRHEGRRGRPLDVLVEWEGEDSDGDIWEESWVSVSELTPDLRAEARQLEMDLFGPRRTRAAVTSRRADGPASRRADRRSATAQRQERERDAQQWRARLRDRARRPLPVSCPARVLIDDFHHIRHLTAPPPPRFVCLGAPLATCALPKGVCYLLTYLLGQWPSGLPSGI